MSELIHEKIIDISQLRVQFKLFKDEIFFVPRHWHEHLELILVIEGIFSIYLNNKTISLKAGDTAVVNCRDIHATQSYEGSLCILLQIPQNILMQCIPDFSKIKFQEVYIAEESEIARQIQKCLIDMNKIFEEKASGYHILFSSLLYKLIYLLYLGHIESPVLMNAKGKQNFERIDSAMQYVQKHYSEQITLKKISSLLALNPDYFCRLFHEYTGQTFIEYVNSVRLKHFYDDLCSTEDNITLLMEKSGFSNCKTFRNLFKSVYGCTPYTCRKQQQTLKKYKL